MTGLALALLLAQATDGASGPIRWQDEGLTVGWPSTVNCTGLGVACTRSGSRLTLNVGGGGGGAPTSATYVTQVPDATLSAEQALSLLGTGLLKSTTGTGVLSIAVAGDLPGGPYEPAGAFSGVGACAGGQYAHTLNDGAAPTCSTPPGTYTLPALTASALGGVKGTGASLVCSGTDKATGFASDGTLQCGADQTSAGGGYATVQEEGSSLTQRTILNFTGAGATCADDTTRTTCTVPGGLTADPAACPANQWVTDQSSSGVLFCSQPGFSNLSGSATASQLPDATGAAKGAIVLTGDLGGTAASPAVVDDSHAHTTTTVSGLDAGADFSAGVLPGARGGVGVALPTCSGSDKLTANGTQVSCAADQTGSGAPTDAQYWVGAAHAGLSAEKDLSGFTGLVLNTAGTPSSKAANSCTNQFPRSDSASGVWTCASIATADLPTIDISKGGTTQTASTEDAVLVGSGTTAWQAKVLPSCSNATTSKLLYDNSTNTFSCGTDQAGAGGSPAWHGVLHATLADADPARIAEGLFRNDATTLAAPTPTNQTASIARCQKFNNPASITVNAVRIWCTAAVNNVYAFAIYPVGTGTSRTWTSGNVPSCTANTWQKITASLPLSLGTGDFWWCQSVNTTGTTAAYRTLTAPIHSGVFGADVAPLGARTGLRIPSYMQFAVTAGALPTTLPTVAAAAFAGGTTGTLATAFLDNSSTP